MTFISTAGHGYLKITHNQLKKAYEKGFKPTNYSYMNRTTVLLEEDCDMNGYMKTMFKDDEIIKDKYRTIKDKYQNDIKRNNYTFTPDNMEEYLIKMNILKLDSSLIGKTFVDIYGDKHIAINVQKSGIKGYIYKSENDVFVMPSQDIVEFL